jgi:hypothetical protein
MNIEESTSKKLSTEISYSLSYKREAKNNRAGLKCQIFGVVFLNLPFKGGGKTTSS